MTMSQKMEHKIRKKRMGKTEKQKKGVQDKDIGAENEEIVTSKLKPEQMHEKMEMSKKNTKDTVPEEIEPNNNLRVHNLPFGTTKSSLKELFKGSLSIKIPKYYGKKVRTAFIEYKTVKEATKIMEKMNGKNLDGRAIGVNYAHKKTEKAPPPVPQTPANILMVRNLSFETSRNTLQAAFEDAIAARIAKWKSNGNSKGFGFVQFNNIEDATKALKSKRGIELDGRKLSLAYSKQDPDDER